MRRITTALVLSLLSSSLLVAAPAHAQTSSPTAPPSVPTVALAQQDHLNQTPAMVVTYRGKRQVIAPVPPYSLLKSYLDELLTK